MMSVVFVLKFGVMQETNNILWLDFFNFNYHAVGVRNLNNTTSEFQNTSLNIWISLKNGLYLISYNGPLYDLLSFSAEVKTETMIISDRDTQFFRNEFSQVFENLFKSQQVLKFHKRQPQV